MSSKNLFPNTRQNNGDDSQFLEGWNCDSWRGMLMGYRLASPEVHMVTLLRNRRLYLFLRYKNIYIIILYYIGYRIAGAVRRLRCGESSYGHKISSMVHCNASERGRT